MSSEEAIEGKETKEETLEKIEAIEITVHTLSHTHKTNMRSSSCRNFVRLKHD